MNKREIKDYIGTFFATLFIIIIIVLVVVANNFSRIKNLDDKQVKKVEIDKNLVLSSIEKLERIELEHPGDYRINMALGENFELLNDYEDAELHYKRAIKKTTGYSPKFALANLYLKMKKFEESDKIVFGIKNKSDKKLLISKGDYYVRFGEAFYNNQEYVKAIEKYKIALKFYKKFDEKKYEQTKSSIAIAYIKEAQDLTLLKSYDDAISALLKSIKYQKSINAYNYLGEVYLKKNKPFKAVKYFDIVFKNDFKILDYNSYDKALTLAMDICLKNGNDFEYEVYSFKHKKFVKYVSNYPLKNSDAEFKLGKIDIITNNPKNYNIKIPFNVKNTSIVEFKHLFLSVSAIDTRNSKMIFHQVYPLLSDSVLEPNADTNFMTLLLDEKLILRDYYRYLRLEFSLSKDNKSWTKFETKDILWVRRR